MAIYIDPPAWPAHGTEFSHLISDSSVGELHAFARELELSPRAFDRDHYDVPAHRVTAAVSLGAQPVSAKQLISVLRSSGLRVPARRRSDKALPVLRARWHNTYPGDLELGESVLRRWSEPHRRYHGPTHLLACLTALDHLAVRVAGIPPSEEVQLAAWFHDAVYNGELGVDERASAHLAQQSLGGALGDEVSRLVLLTEQHVAGPGDLDGCLLVDADLSILAAAPDHYGQYVTEVRQEYSRVSDTRWREGRSAVLRVLLERDPLFLTTWAQNNWTNRASSNVARELAHLFL